MTTQYTSVIASSALGHLYSRSLEGVEVQSKLHANRLWYYHRSHCGNGCLSLPEDYESYRPLNINNDCYISHLLAWLHQGWLPAFNAIPQPFDMPNSKSLDLAPRSIEAEHQKYVEFGAYEEGTSQFISPLLNAVKAHEVKEMISRLKAMNIPVSAEAAADLDLLNALIESCQPANSLLRTVKMRLCVDLSRSINPLLHPWHFSYPGIHSAVTLLEKGKFMAKLDLTKAFLHMPLHPAAQQYFAFRYQGTTFVPSKTPFGASPIPGLCNTQTGELSSILWARGIPNSITTDDIFMVGDSFQECHNHILTATAIIQDLGWILNQDKIEGPARRLTMLGIDIDSEAQTLSLSSSRLQAYRDELLEVLDLSQVSNTLLYQLIQVRTGFHRSEWSLKHTLFTVHRYRLTSLSPWWGNYNG